MIIECIKCIKCIKCNTIVEPKADTISTNCKCGCVHVLWDIFEVPRKPIEIRSIDSKGLKITNES